MFGEIAKPGAYTNMSHLLSIKQSWNIFLSSVYVYIAAVFCLQWSARAEISV